MYHISHINNDRCDHYSRAETNQGRFSGSKNERAKNKETEV